MNASRLILLFLLIVLLQSCAGNDITSEDSTMVSCVSETQIVTKASLKQYYHEDTGFLIQEREDPFIATSEDEITHRAIEFRPKCLEEYNNLMAYSDTVFISYFPFGFSPVRELSEKERYNYSVFPLDEKYYISYSEYYDDSLNTNGSLYTLPEDSKLPYLYAIWPTCLAVPEQIEHFYQYGVHLPERTSNKQESSRFEGTGQINLPITINTYDSFLGSYVPMAGIKVRVTDGSFYCDYNMNSSGSATIQPLMFNDELTLNEISQLQVYVIYQTPYFTVSRNTAIIPIQKYLGTVSSLWGPMSYNTTYSTYVSHQSSGTNECDVYQGAYYYFYGSHAFSSLIASSELGGIVIHASTNQPGYPSETYDTLPGTPIYVYDESTGADCIASTIHELGHVHHLKINSNYSTTQILIKESFASYIGWYVGEQYYFSKGYVRPFPGLTINMQDRQEWAPNSPLFIDDPGMYNYTPIFIDLTDDYNQVIITDTISGVPVSIINNMGASCTTVSECMSYLLTFVGTYFTSSELTTHFSYYL